MAASPEPTPPRGRVYLSLGWRILLTTLLAGLIPLLLLGWDAIQGAQAASDRATKAASDALDSKALAALHRLATDRAREVAGVLSEAVTDTLTAAELERLPDLYLAFYRDHEREIVYPDASGQAHEEMLPLYREIAYIDASGREQIHIQDGALVAADNLRDVSVPQNTTYLTETYFSETRSLPAGQVYVSHLLAWHLSSERQPALQDSALTTDGQRYAKYKAEVRFATPVFNAQGAFDGMVMLTLDARHLIEEVIHLLPGSIDGDITWPDVATRDYAYMWDDEGYYIAYPSLAGLRGLDAAGRLVPPASTGMPADEQARHPLVVQNSANPQLLDLVLRNQTGVISNTVRAAVFAPIPFPYGAYAKTGVFGGLALSADETEFHTAAALVRGSIDSERGNLQGEILVIGLAALLLLAGAATLLAYGITQPVRRLTSAARSMEQGELDVATLRQVIDRRLHDEISKLAQVFKQMAEQVQLRERSLKEQIQQLRIEIDERQTQQQVAELTETAYFRDLQQRAHEMRARHARPLPSAGENSGSDGP